MTASTELDRAVGAAARATLTLHALMASHGIASLRELSLLLVLPVDLRGARRAWMAAMVAVVNAVGHAEGVQDMAALSERDKVRLTHRAYDLVLSQPVEAGRGPSAV
jgi:hypothetical protein